MTVCRRNAWPRAATRASVVSPSPGGDRTSGAGGGAGTARAWPRLSGRGRPSRGWNEASNRLTLASLSDDPQHPMVRVAARLQRDQFNQSAIPLNVSGVESEQPTLTMGEHRRGDIGIMDLTASKSIIAAQFAELIPYCRAILQHAEPTGECRRVGDGLRQAERLSPGLLTGHRSQVLTQYLPADRQPLIARDTYAGRRGPYRGMARSRPPRTPGRWYRRSSPAVVAVHVLATQTQPLGPRAQIMCRQIARLERPGERFLGRTIRHDDRDLMLRWRILRNPHDPDVRSWRTKIKIAERSWPSEIAPQPRLPHPIGQVPPCRRFLLASTPRRTRAHSGAGGPRLAAAGQVAVVRPLHARPHGLRRAGRPGAGPHQPAADRQAACPPARRRRADRAVARRGPCGPRPGPRRPPRTRLRGAFALRGCCGTGIATLRGVGNDGISRTLKAPVAGTAL